MSYLSLGDENDEDGDFFGSPVGGSSSSGSRLGSLFGLSSKMDNNAGSNQSLTYTAPKPPKQEKSGSNSENKTSQPQAAPGVAVAVAITAFRYVNNQYQKHGKLGAALLQNYAEKDYKILMYISKQQPVTTAKITSEFDFNIQSNNYASFYDDQRQMWSILFDSYDQLVSFAKQVCLAKYNSSDATKIITQDLDHGDKESRSIESGDSVEVKYTGWLVQQGILGSVFDSNQQSQKTFRFQTGKGKVIKGWEQGMLAMKKNGKRFLIIPPALAYGTASVGNRVPSNSTLAFEVIVLRVKHSKGKNAQVSSTESVPLAMPQASLAGEPEAIEQLETPPVAQISSDETVKGRTASFNDQLAHSNMAPDSNKAKLVSRMAKMGQAMLPQTAVPAQDPQQAAAAVPRVDKTPTYSSGSPAMLEQPYMQNAQATFQTTASPREMASPQIQPQTVLTEMSAGQFQRSAMSPYAVNYGSYPSHFTPLPQYSMGPELLPSILAESRQHSSDLKTIQEKLEKVGDNLEDLKKNSETNQNRVNETMDGALLSYNINRIIQENDKMKKQVLEKNKQIESQSSKIADLLQQNQKYMEDNHLMMEKRNLSFKETFGQSQERTLQLEQEKLALSNKLSDATSKLCEMQLSLANSKEHGNSLEKRLAELSSRAVSKDAKDEKKYQEMEEKMKVVEHKLKTEETKARKLESQMEEKMQIKKDEMEREMEAAWRLKCKEAVAKVTKAAEEKISESRQENEESSEKLEILHNKFLKLKSLYEEKTKEEKSLQEKVAELNVFQQKYLNLRKQTTLMKEKYETMIEELQEKSEKEQGTDEQDGNITNQIKGIMNSVFQQVRGKVQRDEEYSGAEILGIILSIIKKTTLNLLTPHDEEEDSEDDAEEDSEEEEDGSDEGSDPGRTEEQGDEEIDSIQETKKDASSDKSDEDDPQEEEAGGTERLSRDVGNLETDVVPDPEESKEEKDQKSEDHEKEDKESEKQKEEVKESQDSQETGNDVTKEENQVVDTVCEDGDHVNSKEKVPDLSPGGDPLAPTERPTTPLSDGKPEPPPLFDDGDDDENSDWLG